MILSTGLSGHIAPLTQYTPTHLQWHVPWSHPFSGESVHRRPPVRLKSASSATRSWATAVATGGNGARGGAVVWAAGGWERRNGVLEGEEGFFRTSGAPHLLVARAGFGERRTYMESRTSIELGITAHVHVYQSRGAKKRRMASSRRGEDPGRWNPFF